MKATNYIIGTISALAGIIFIIYMGISALLVQDSFLNYTNAKYGIAESLSMTEEDLQKAVHSMISYVRGDLEDAQVMVLVDGEETAFFNEKELVHLSDVRGVLEFLGKVTTAFLVVCVLGEVYLIVKKRAQEALNCVWIAWGIMIVCSVLIALVAMNDINQIVVGFHELFFSNDLWLLNPATDRSVWMFKNEMYSDALVRIAGIVAVTALVTMGGATFLKKKIWWCDV